MKLQEVAWSLLLFSLSPLQPAHATIVSQSCQDNYDYDYYGNPTVLLSTTCYTSSVYALQGTVALRNTTNGASTLTLNISGTLNQSGGATTDLTGYSYGQTSNNMTLSVTGIGTYTMSSLDYMVNGSQYNIGAVTNSVTGGFTTDNTTKWSIWSDGINALVYTLDGDSDGIPGFNLYLNGAEYRVADVQLATVPVPAAFWLFGSGLMGFFAAVRRKRATAR